MVRRTGFEPPASCSQSRRATNCATPGYEVVGGLGGFSQSRRATNCATPDMEVVGVPGRILPNVARYQLRYTPIFFLLFFTTARGAFRLAIVSRCGALARPCTLAWLPSTSASLFPPLAALGYVHQLRYTPIFLFFCFYCRAWRCCPLFIGLCRRFSGPARRLCALAHETFARIVYYRQKSRASSKMLDATAVPPCNRTYLERKKVAGMERNEKKMEKSDSPVQKQRLYLCGQ